MWVVILIAFIIFIIWLINHSAEESKKEQTKLEYREADQKRFDDWLETEYEKAKVQRRSDEEIKKYAQVKWGEIIAKEQTITGEWGYRQTSIGNSIRVYNIIERLKETKKGREILEWWQEPLKELAEAKRFVAEGGPEQTEKEKRLAKEKLEAKIVLERKKFEENLEKKEKTDETD